MHLGVAAAIHRAVTPPGGRRAPLHLLVTLLIALNCRGRIGAGIFSCTPGCALVDDAEQRLHQLAATLAFWTLIGGALLAAPLFRCQAILRPLAPYSLLSAAAGVVLRALMSASGEDGRRGRVQRAATGGAASSPAGRATSGRR